MRKTLVTLAWAAIPAVLISLSACNGNPGSSTGMAPLPNAPASTHSHVRPGALSVNLHGGGATFPAYGYNLGDQPVGLPPGQATPGPGSVLAAADHTFTDSAVTYYCLTGSGFGRSAFETNNGNATKPCAGLSASAPTGLGGEEDPLDFVGSDVALPSTECCASGTTYYNGRLTGSKTWGQPFEMPTYGGPIVFGYVQKSFSTNNAIQLSTWTYCAIVNGTVTDWNDPAVTADNDGNSITGGTSEPITFYYRSDSSGTSYLFQYKLSNNVSGCNQNFQAPYNAPPYGSASRSAAWTHSYGMHWNGPTTGGFKGANGNPGVLASIQGDSTGFATGYVEGAWAASTKGEPVPVAQASLQNGFKIQGSKAVANFVSPTNATAVAQALKQVNGSSIQYGQGSDGNPLGSSTPWCQLYIPPADFVNPKTIKAYPIVGLSYWLFYGKNNGIHVADKTALAKFMASGSLASILAPLEYTPLNTAIATKINKALNGAGKKGPCLQ
jgi:ABC-type phosphate transport system substrate-binding protein